MLKKTIVFILILFITLSLNSYEINKGKYSFYLHNNNVNVEDEPVDEDDVAFKILLLIGLAPFYLPYELLNRDETGPLKFQKYPFEKSNSFYHDEGKNWCINTLVLYHLIKDYNYGFEWKVDAYYKRFGLQVYSQIYKQKENSEKEISLAFIPSYTFARNRFINFQTGIGYNYEESVEKTHGILWNYKINVYSKPIQLQISNDLNISFPNNEDKTRVDENLSVKIGYYIKHFPHHLDTILILSIMKDYMDQILV